LEIYYGSKTSFTITNLEPFRKYSFSLKLITPINDERSPISDSITIETEEALPGPPTNLKLAGATTTITKVTWDPPNETNGTLLFYYVYKDDALIEQTLETMIIISGLQPSTVYNIQVCACTSKGKGEGASISVTTCSSGDVVPERPTFGPIGMREVLVKWQPPETINSRLNRYELLMNGKIIFTGLALEHQVCQLKPDTEYKFQVNILQVVLTEFYILNLFFFLIKKKR
jgi:hypothetical protein